MQNNTNIDFLIIRSFSEALTPEDHQLLNDWLKESDENKTYYIELLSIWQSSHPVFDLASIDLENAKRRVISQLSKQSFLQIPFVIWFQRVAAILLIPVLILLGHLAIRLYDDSQSLAYQELESPNGIVSKISLPDGSSVWLNSGSSLKFPARFREDERRIFLSGEGYFVVHSDKKHPFVVETSYANIKATGTQFNVETYKSDTITAITLIEGVVDVSFANNNKTNIRPNQRVVYNSKSNKYDLTNTDAQKWSSWKDGKLVFRDESLSDVFKRLSRAFNVDIIIKDKAITSQTYRATFDGESLDVILHLLQLTTPLKYKRSGNIKLEDGTYKKEVIEVYMTQ